MLLLEKCYECHLDDGLAMFLKQIGAFRVVRDSCRELNSLHEILFEVQISLEEKSAFI